MTALLEQTTYTETVYEKALREVRAALRKGKAPKARHEWGYTFKVQSQSQPGLEHTVELNGWYNLEGATCSGQWCKDRPVCIHRAYCYYLVVSWMERREGGRKWAEREQKKVEFSRGELLCTCCEIQPIAHIDTDYCIGCAGEYENEHRWTGRLDG